MAKRDRARKKIKAVSENEKIVMMNKFKQLQNQVNSRIRKESVAFNNKRINAAKTEKEVWNVVYDMFA